MTGIITIKYGKNLTETFMVTSSQFQLQNNGYYLALENDKIVTNAKVILTKNLKILLLYQIII